MRNKGGRQTGRGERMVSYWTNFAKTGNPNGVGLPEWKPCTKVDKHIQKLDVK